jgi:curli biogenesis system outer membrane secretion channel CsgG
MRKLLFLGFLLSASLVQAQKVAVFDPIGNLSEDSKSLIREEISNVIISDSKFQVVERRLIQKVLDENRFQSTGLVSESQLSELGRKAGADLVCITVAVREVDDWYLSCKLINYQTSQIIRQSTATTSWKNLSKTAKSLAKDIFKGKAITSAKQTGKKIAIFEPDGNVGSAVKTIVSEEIGCDIVKNPNFIVLERANIDKVLEENRFQSKNSSEAEMRELGKMMGANYIGIITITDDAGKYKIFGKQVNVSSGVVANTLSPNGIKRAQNNLNSASTPYAYFWGGASFLGYGLIAAGVGCKFYSNGEYDKYHAATEQKVMDDYYNKANITNKAFYGCIGAGVAVLIGDFVWKKAKNREAAIALKNSNLGVYYNPDANASGVSLTFNF